MIHARQPLFVHRGPGRNFEVERWASAQEIAVVAYVDESAANSGAAALDFAEWRERKAEAPSIVTALDSGLRRRMAERILAEGGTIATVAPSSENVSLSATFSAGVLVENGVLNISFSTAFGRHTILLTPLCVGHDVAVGDFVTIHPSVSISGYVIVEDGVTIGAGALIANGTPAKPLQLGRDSRIEPGAVVTKSVPPGAVVAGNPARTLRAETLQA